jgi:hypothetical protein
MLLHVLKCANPLFQCSPTACSTPRARLCPGTSCCSLDRVNETAPVPLCCLLGCAAWRLRLFLHRPRAVAGSHLNKNEIKQFIVLIDLATLTPHWKQGVFFGTSNSTILPKAICRPPSPNNAMRNLAFELDGDFHLLFT